MPNASNPPADCSIPRPIICKKDPENNGNPPKEKEPKPEVVEAGVRYQSFPDTGTQAEAEAFCTAQGGRMPVADSPAKATLLAGILSGAPPSMNFWVGNGDHDPSIVRAGGCTTWSGADGALIPAACGEEKNFFCEF